MNFLYQHVSKGSRCFTIVGYFRSNSRIQKQYFSTIPRHKKNSKKKGKWPISFPFPKIPTQLLQHNNQKLQHLRLRSEPRLKSRLTLATEFHRHTNDISIDNSKIIDLNNSITQGNDELKDRCDFLPSKKKAWIKSPLKAQEWPKLLSKTGQWKEYEPLPDSSCSMKELEDKKIELEATQRYREELKESMNYQSDDPRKRRRSTIIHDKTSSNHTYRYIDNPHEGEGIYGVSEEEYYKKYFKDKFRGLEEVDPSEVDKKIKELEMNEHENSGDTQIRSRRRRARWRSQHYERPDLRKIMELGKQDFFLIVLHERYQLGKDRASFNYSLWGIILNKIEQLLPTLSSTRLLQFLDVLSDLQVFILSIVIYLSKVHFNEVQLSSRNEYLKYLISLSKMKCQSHSSLTKSLKSSTLLWPTLSTHQLIKASNAISQLGLGEYLYTDSLRLVLNRRIGYLGGNACRDMTALTALSLLQDDSLILYLEQSMKYWWAFKGHTKSLHIIELFLRLCRQDLYDQLDDEVKGFLDFVRTEPSMQSLKEKDTTMSLNWNEHLLKLNSAQQFKGSYDCSSIKSLELIPYLKELSLEPLLDMQAGPYNIPLYIPASSTVIEIVSKNDYFFDSSINVTPSTQFFRFRRHHLIKAMGFHLVTVSTHQWNAILGHSARVREFCARFEIVFIMGDESLEEDSVPKKGSDSSPEEYRKRHLTCRASGLEARRHLFEKYAENYHERFRAAIDYQFAEEPRQVIGLFVLILGCVLFGVVWDRVGTDVTNNEYGPAARSALSAVLFASLVYCFLQTRDGLLVRPHPGFWRIWHAIGLVHLLVFCILAALGTCDLQCKFSLRTLKIQMSKMWFYAHILGWFAKMCIFRDWNFCLVLSLAFETIELSFQWLIPELKECWWDSIILDVLLTNMIGMIVGVAFLRLFNSLGYDWINKRMSKETNGAKHSMMKKVVMRFTPFTWSKYHWSFFRTPERLFQAIVLLLLALLTELNVFLMMYALDIPAPHFFHKLRIAYLCFLALSGVAETYHYVNQGGSPHLKRRIGHNAWLFVAIIILEFVVVIRYGKTRFRSIIPTVGVIIPWSVTLVCALMWSFAHFWIVGPERLDVPKTTWDNFMQQLQLGTFEIQSITPSDDTAANSSTLQSTPTKISTTSATCNKNNETLRQRKMKTVFTPPPHTDYMSPSISADELELDSVELCTMAEYMSPLKTISSPAKQQEEYLDPQELNLIMKEMKRRREKWGRLFDYGVWIVSLPPLLCFLPLATLVRFYDYD